MAPPVQSAKRIFKFVSGVLNGAFDESGLADFDSEIRCFLSSQGELCFQDACDALAKAITEGHVPKQGQDVLRSLLQDQHHQTNMLNLCHALGVAPTIQFSKEAAQQLFRLVSGVMSQAYPESEASLYTHAVHSWIDVSGVATFEQSCQALALAIQRGVVPDESVSILKLLHKAGVTDVGSDLAELLTSEFPQVGLEEDTDVDSDVHQDLNNTEKGDMVVESEIATEVEMVTETSAEEMVSEADRQESAKRLFKRVAGILNGAYSAADVSEEGDINLWIKCADFSFFALCDALAAAVAQQYVPAQGRDVLCKLAEQMRHNGLTSTSKLAVELKLDLDKPDPIKAAARIFSHVTGILKGTSVSSLSRADVAVWSADDTDEFSGACAALTAVVSSNSMPEKAIQELCDLISAFPEHGLLDSPLEEALVPFLCPSCEHNPCKSVRCGNCGGSGKRSCPGCRGSGKFTQPCRGCNGSGAVGNRRRCNGCGGSGRYIIGECRSCQGTGATSCLVCDTNPATGKARPFCRVCAADAEDAQKAAQKAMQEQRANRGNQGNFRKTGPPPAGVSIDRCNRAELTRLQNLWLERQSQQMPGGARACGGEVVAAWKVDNPLLAYQFKSSRDEYKREHGREMDKLEGYHGTHPDNVISICSTGFDAGRRAGQVYGAGEYFAKNPHVSVGYCRGGEYMLVCRLSLGKPSSTQKNTDGDHIWVPENGYYVIKHPSQVLVQYIVKYKLTQSYYGGAVLSESLERNLSKLYDTKPPPARKDVPNPRPCVMTMPSTTALWMGLMSPHISEEELKRAVQAFLSKNASAYPIDKLQILRTHFSKAHVFLKREMPRAVVKSLNEQPFKVDNTTTRLCVDSFFGSPEQKCPKWIAGYCRGQNLRFTSPCWCKHETRPTEGAKYTLTSIPLDGAKGDEIKSKFMASAPFHNGMPKIVGIKQIKNDRLLSCHEEYRKWLTDKHGEEPAVQELYHGTNNNILDVLYTHGLSPPSDMEPSDACRVSGGKGLCTSLCNNSCIHCTKKHEWKRCHMYGLGIYLGDMSQKSNRYISQPKSGRYKMIVCSVLGKSYEIDGYLKGDRCMHDVHDVRALTSEDMDEMIDVCQPCLAPASGIGASIVGMDNGEKWGQVVGEDYSSWRLSSGRIAKKETEGLRWQWSTEGMSSDAIETAAEKSDLIFVKGLGSRTKVGYSVVNSEYIAFHPHQCLPLYEIEYELY